MLARQSVRLFENVRADRALVMLERFSYLIQQVFQILQLASLRFNQGTGQVARTGGKIQLVWLARVPI